MSVTVNTPSGTSKWLFYQSWIQTEANRIDYSNNSFCPWDFCSVCNSGGKAFLAMQGWLIHYACLHSQQ